MPFKSAFDRKFLTLFKSITWPRGFVTMELEGVKLHLPIFVQNLTFGQDPDDLIAVNSKKLAFV